MDRFVRDWIMYAVCLMIVTVWSSGCTAGRNGKLDTSFAHDTDSTAIDYEIPFCPLLPVAPDLRIVYFDYNSSTLRADALEALSENAKTLKQLPGTGVRLEGHCDDRGTQAYNMALGERRALAIREHLMRLGISGDRIHTISYGEEMPADPGHNEAAWAKNRRCVFGKGR